MGVGQNPQHRSLREDSMNLELRMATEAGRWSDVARLQKRYSEDQPREADGKFGSGGSGATVDSPHGGPSQKPRKAVVKGMGSAKGDYKTHATKVMWSLAAHKERWDELVSLGVESSKASSQAYQELKGGKLNAYGAK